MITVVPLRCYSLWYVNRHGDEVCFYAGETAKTIEHRLAAHIEAFCRGEPKRAYDRLRRLGITEFYAKPEEGSEAAVIARLRRAGWKLYNDNDGVRASYKIHGWRELNDSVLKKLQGDTEAEAQKLIETFAVSISSAATSETTR